MDDSVAVRRGNIRKSHIDIIPQIVFIFDLGEI